MVERIVFNKPHLTGKELEYVAEALASRKLSGDGDFTKRCQSLIEMRARASFVRLTTSCSAALEIAAILARARPGDEVIVPAYTFVTSANAFLLHGFTPVFVDVREDTLNLDARALERAITPRTRVIVAVHYAGVACDMDDISAIARAHGALVVEDAAQAFSARYRGKFLGTLGDLGCYSFHDTKSVVCGEGGAIVVNRPDLEAAAEIVRDKGTNRTALLRGLVDQYTWMDAGSSYLPADVLAAILLAQLEATDEIMARRRALWLHYHAGLAPLARAERFRAPVIPEHTTPIHLHYHVVTEGLEARTRLIQFLGERGISAAFHHVPLHLSPMGKRFGAGPGSLPVVEAAANGLVRLPLHLDMTEADVDRVIEAVHELYATRG